MIILSEHIYQLLLLNYLISCCLYISNAAGCRAVKHCIQTVWEHQDIEPDTDSVCQICLKMVKEARDQLESNETQVY